MRNVISVRVQNVPGVLSHVAGMLASRGYNVDSLTVGPTNDPRFSRMTIVLDAEHDVMRQIELQLEKLVTVVKVLNLSTTDHVERELALVQVGCKPGERTGVLELVNIFRASVVDVASDSLLVEVSGSGNKIDGFLKALAPYPVLSSTRSGIIAAPRGVEED